MEHNDDMRPASKVRILPNDPAQTTDALYSEPFSSNLESVERPTLKPDFQPIESPVEPKKKDTISTGTFGNLVRKSNQGATLSERAADARHRIRFNLKKVGPRPKSTDECEAWRKYLF